MEDQIRFYKQWENEAIQGANKVGIVIDVVVAAHAHILGVNQIKNTEKYTRHRNDGVEINFLNREKEDGKKYNG